MGIYLSIVMLSFDKLCLMNHLMIDDLHYILIECVVFAVYLIYFNGQIKNHQLKIVCRSCSQVLQLVILFYA